jgi:hypothetical protein
VLYLFLVPEFFFSSHKVYNNLLDALCIGACFLVS